MDDHIDHFNKLLQEIEYNKPPNAPEKDPGEVNLIFLTSLGEKWKSFLHAKGPNLRNIDTDTLTAEVSAMNDAETKPETNPSQYSEAKALGTQFYGNRHGRRGGWNGGNQSRGRGRGRGRIGKRYSKPVFNPNKYCTRCEKQGHDIDMCWTAAKEREAANPGNNDTGSTNQSQRSSDRPYQPSFTRPSYSA